MYSIILLLLRLANFLIRSVSYNIDLVNFPFVFFFLRTATCFRIPSRNHEKVSAT